MAKSKKRRHNGGEMTYMKRAPIESFTRPADLSAPEGWSSGQDIRYTARPGYAIIKAEDGGLRPRQEYIGLPTPGRASGMYSDPAYYRAQSPAGKISYERMVLSQPNLFAPHIVAMVRAITRAATEAHVHDLKRTALFNSIIAGGEVPTPSQLIRLGFDQTVARLPNVLIDKSLAKGGDRRYLSTLKTTVDTPDIESYNAMFGAANPGVSVDGFGFVGLDGTGVLSTNAAALARQARLAALQSRTDNMETDA